MKYELLVLGSGAGGSAVYDNLPSSSFMLMVDQKPFCLVDLGLGVGKQVIEIFGHFPKRVIVLAMVNYTTAMFLFASVYQLIGHFSDVPAYLAVWGALIQSLQTQFALGAPFEPADAQTWWLMTSHGIFCFTFGTIVISLFVSLLNVKPLRA
ncbi:MAG: hypothetical protein IE937_00975 [Gammaproteobacteria bacterium]|nr:hypothetical protein [Gammaproteobacteria bacterium]